MPLCGGAARGVVPSCFSGIVGRGGNRMSPTLLASDDESMDREWTEGDMDLEAWADEWAVEQVLLADDGALDSS